MRKPTRPLQCSMLALTLAFAIAAAHATTIIDNANGYTLNAKGDVVQFASLAFDDAGRILAAGTLADVAAKVPQATHVDAAQAMTDKVLPQPTEQEARTMLDRALATMASVGHTSAHDAGVGVGEDRLYRDYADHGKLTARIYAMVGGTGADFDQQAKNGPLNGYGHDMYALRAVKLYADGALGSRGAALVAPNPFFGIHAAVTRQDADGNPSAGWYPEQEMSLKEAFRCFTLDAAYAGHQENTLGSLERDKYADFIVVDRDLFKMSPYDVHKTVVLETWVGGHRVYRRP
ncbi:amidohydrolase family protein [Massilia sp. TW-1]|uniref:Amidohydrolase family protein n=1 Tax=Telluria antibiotica TaxID=2717319 RepID=A0ABX0PHX1_9BURK|nr:amidohydrolase family protein [Telluria antibiotica]NIA56757.1 amidohydrolase family protein [Telluria antibiotica]